ncbi:hypothetical protein GCM10008995_04110 [Halobellus salinus]|uniref:site-specific DNA-methyltransferase (adenine-specific) n=1 Tax=Halobellus salinus TaxID=931585 RepID=A0A830EPH3_9EURY|nr:TaqI-like C-terminal specificity domain-containing protein [Halobellus salinus]GGI97355.1 hypothetical protein GCM10008995_04110 [Halobellus salinus]SMP07655.1 N-6 DNA Methylase [Halobellus salinus]
MSQATISERPYLNAALFSSHYLDERVRERDEWDCDDAAREAMNDLRTLYELEGPLVEGYGEDALVDNWIDEVLDVLGFGTQQEVALPDGGGFVDELLFETAAARRDAAGVYLDTDDTTDLFARGLGIVEAKQRDAAFDVRYDERRPYRNASHQTKHYLENTPPNIQWGVLTNGRKWRLYGTNDYETQTYYEVDLPELLERGDLEAFKYFYVFFRPGAFHESGGTTFLDEVWSESETASQELGENLQDNVFTALRVLGRGFVETNDTLDIDPDDEERLDELKEQSLVFLYRLMFVLYAEARGLIHPEGQSAQDEYEENFSLDELRLEVHDAIGEVDEGFTEEFSDYSTTMWSRLEDLFRLIDEGEADLGIPPYNGGLFDHDAHDFLTDHEVSNRYLAEVVYRLSTTRNAEGRYVLADYADLDTRHLGSVYEGLLEHQFRIAPEQYAAVSEDGGQVWKPATEVSVADAVETVPEGGLYVVNDEGERKATGAYYTPDYVVTYIVEETVGPLVEEIRADLREQGFEPGTQEFIGPFIRRITDLRILDPAMGSGHFLTKATGYLSSEVLTEYRAAEVEMGQAFDEESLRRDIAKECIYGVDLNGMAVELAKLSMWLETLASDRPLAFLDHHFKQGNSLVGSDIEAIEELESDASADDDSQASLAEFGATREGTIERLMAVYSEFLAIENEGIDDVQAMKRKYAEIEQDDLRQRLVAMANVHTAERFDLDVPGGAYERMAKALEDDGEWADVVETDWFESAQALAENKDFFHWKLAFPEAFYREDGGVRGDAGFDAVIGNPPYGAEFSKSLQSYLDYRYTVRGIEYDSYIFFVELGHKLLRTNGEFGYIIPTVWTKLENNEPLRTFLLKNSRIRHIVDCGKIFKSTGRQPIVDTLILIVRKSIEDQSTLVRSVPGNSVEDRLANLGERRWDVEYETDQERFTQNQPNSIKYHTYDPDHLNLIRKIEEQSVRLEEISKIGQGVTAYDRRAGQPDEVVENRAYHSNNKENETYGRWLNGRNISRYELSWSGEWLSYGDWLVFSRDKDLFTKERLLFREVTGGLNRIIATHSDEEYYYGHSIIPAVVSESKFDGLTLLGIVNSNVLSYYHLSESPNAQKEVFPKMNPSDVESLPITSGIPPEAEDKISSNCNEMLSLKQDRNDINLNLLDYLGNYRVKSTLPDIGFYTPVADSSSYLHRTTKEMPNLRIGSVEVEREAEDTVRIHATARYKPDNEDEYDTDRWGYTETDPIPAMRLTDLTGTEAALVEAFVPVAVDEAGGFANFRETATKTNSLIDRLEALTLPDPDDVADGLERYVDARDRAADLDAKIERTDALIDEIVYELYGLTDEEVEIVEEAVGEDEE